MSFRLYLSGISRRFEPAKEFVATTEEEAIAIAEKARSGRAAELWLGNRMVKEWTSHHPPGNNDHDAKHE